MGKANRFMPTEEFSVLEDFHDGEIWWYYGEDEANWRSMLIISFRRKDINFKNFVTHSDTVISIRNVLNDAEDYYTLFDPELMKFATDKNGEVFRYEVEEPHGLLLQNYLFEAKMHFIKGIMFEKQMQLLVKNDLLTKK